MRQRGESRPAGSGRCDGAGLDEVDGVETSGPRKRSASRRKSLRSAPVASKSVAWAGAHRRALEAVGDQLAVDVVGGLGVARDQGHVVAHDVLDGADRNG